MDLQLTGRVGIVTGAAQGIGKGIARALLSEGARVTLVDINGGQLERTAAELSAVYGADRVLAHVADVVSTADVAAAVDATIAQFEQIDCLVNNAGFPRDSYISKMSTEAWDTVVDVILKGAFLFTKACMPHMIAREYGRVISISSRAHLGNPGQANYSAAKAGIIGLTRAISLESGKFNITANAIAPGFIRTPGIESLPNYEQVARNAIAKTPVPRVGEVEDIAAVAAFLASPLAGYISGEVIHVTGGRYA